MKTNRRSFFALMGATPIAAKATLDAEIAKTAGAWSVNGIGDASLRLAGGYGAPAALNGSEMPYERRIMGAADYIKMFGVPEVMEYELRDQSRSVGALDPDIACKASWSMSVKLMTQRERNYQRSVERVEKSGWQYKKRSALKTLLGFDWPW
jgi:hypothetical protein